MTGIRLLQGTTLRVLLADAPRVSAGAALLVALIVTVGLRRRRDVLLTLVSLAGGLAWAVGVLAVTGVRLSIANLVGLPILVGLGVDVVLHLALRLREGLSPARALLTVGRAATVSTLTTAVSFAALIAASTGSIRALGELVAVGLPVVTAASAVLLVILAPSSD